MPREPISGPDKRLIFGSTAILAVLLFAAVRLDAIDREPEWDFPAAPKMPVPNGHDIYEQAEASMVLFTTPVDSNLDRRWAPGSKNPPVDYSLARRRQWLQVNQAAFSMAEKARQCEYWQPLRSKNRTQYRMVPNLCLYLGVAGKTYWMGGQYDRAVTVGLDAVELGVKSLRGGTGEDLYQAAYGARRGVRPILRSVPHLSGAQLRQYSGRLKGIIDTYPSNVEILENSKWVSLFNLKEMMRVKGWRDSLIPDSSSTNLRRFVVQLRSKESVRQQLSDWFDESIAEMKRGNSGEMTEPRYSSSNRYLFDYFAGVGANITKNSGVFQARLRMLLLAFYLQEYKVAQGRYPATLDELKNVAPKYKSDPCKSNGGTFGYRLGGEGYLMWSIGDDKVDNGGTSTSSIKDGLQQWDMQSGDIVMAMPLAPEVIEPEPTPKPVPAPPAPPAPQAP